MAGRKPDYAKRFVAAARGSHPYSKNKGAPKLAKAASALLVAAPFRLVSPCVGFEPSALETVQKLRALGSCKANENLATVAGYRSPRLLSSNARAAVSGVTKFGPVNTVSCEGMMPYLI